MSATNWTAGMVFQQRDTRSFGRYVKPCKIPPSMSVRPLSQGNRAGGHRLRLSGGDGAARQIKVA